MITTDPRIQELMARVQEYANAFHLRDSWRDEEAAVERAALALISPPPARRMTGQESSLIHEPHRGLHDDTGSWCKFYGCEPLTPPSTANAAPSTSAPTYGSTVEPGVGAARIRAGEGG